MPFGAGLSAVQVATGGVYPGLLRVWCLHAALYVC